MSCVLGFGGSGVGEGGRGESPPNTGKIEILQDLDLYYIRQLAHNFKVRSGGAGGAVVVVVSSHLLFSLFFFIPPLFSSHLFSFLLFRFSSLPVFLSSFVTFLLLFLFSAFLFSLLRFSYTFISVLIFFLLY